MNDSTILTRSAHDFHGNTAWKNLSILACISSCKSRMLWPLDLMRTYCSFSGKHVRSHIFYPINILLIESKGYGIKLATACALNEQEINNECLQIYYFLFCIHCQLISRYSLEHVLLQTHIFSCLKKSDFTGTIMSFLGQNCCWCWWWLSVLLQSHQIVDHHCWKLAKRYSSSLFSNLTLDREPKFPWKIEDMKNILKTSELDG